MSAIFGSSLGSLVSPFFPGGYSYRNDGRCPCCGRYGYLQDQSPFYQDYQQDLANRLQNSLFPALTQDMLAQAQSEKDYQASKLDRELSKHAVKNLLAAVS